MRAVLMRATGDPDVLQVEQVPVPRPEADQVLIRVRAAAVNPIDWKLRRGLRPKPLPAVLGSDVSGTVVQSRATGFAEGDEVFGFASSGSYAEFATAAKRAIALKPPELSHQQAAALPVSGLTAWQALFDSGGLRGGQTVVIAGAAGGVGHLAVQLAANAGARVTGIGSAGNRDFVLSLGAAQYVDYTSEDIAQAVRDVALALDTVGGPVTEQLLETVARGGVLVTIASAPPQEAAAARGARAEMLSMSTNPEQLAIVGELAADGRVRVEIAETFPLADAPRAHALSESGHARGKLVLVVEA
jgi:NADPH:quinone reductase-like Zn-dependent oxidoreductase